MEGVPESLSAKFKGSFAYGTIKDRLPIILTKIADTVHRSKSWIKEKYGEDSQEDLKAIAGCVSKLRNEVQTNKPVIHIKDSRQDSKIWNDYLGEVTETEGKAPSWFVSPWLYVECYMYRRIQEGVELSFDEEQPSSGSHPSARCKGFHKYFAAVIRTSLQRNLNPKLVKHNLHVAISIDRDEKAPIGALSSGSQLQTFDVFGEQKERALRDSTQAVLTLLNYLRTVVEDLGEGKPLDIHKLFLQFAQVSLWGNKCDLSISAGFENSQISCPLDQVNSLRSYILLDNLEQAWEVLKRKEPSQVDIVLDNAGFEFVTDLCLAEFLVAAKLANCVHFHAKAFPWFVSDVTKTDLDFTFQVFQQSNSLSMNKFATLWKERFQEGSWKFEAHDFWTTPFDFSDMKSKAADLYENLGKSSFVFFKGDLNYRKLVGDRNWPTTTPFETSLRGFHPAPLLSLRALKADVVTGLQEGQAEEVAKKDEDWMVNGSWAVMALCDKVVPL